MTTNAGLQIINTSGTIQIDHNYCNFGLSAKVNVTASQALSWVVGSPVTGQSTVYTYRGNYTFNATNPVAAIGITTSAVRAIDYLKNNGNGTWTVGVLSSVSNDAVTLYLFDQGVTSGGHAGLKVFNASGVPVFDSGSKYMRIAGFSDTPYKAYQFNYFSYPLGPTYAVLPTNASYYATPGQTEFTGGVNTISTFAYSQLPPGSTINTPNNDPGANSNTQFIVNGAGLTIGTEGSSTTGQGPLQGSTYDYQFLMLDVTTL